MTDDPACSLRRAKRRRMRSSACRSSDPEQPTEVVEAFVFGKRATRELTVASKASLRNVRNVAHSTYDRMPSPYGSSRASSAVARGMISMV